MVPVFLLQGFQWIGGIMGRSGQQGGGVAGLGVWMCPEEPEVGGVA